MELIEKFNKLKSDIDYINGQCGYLKKELSDLQTKLTENKDILINSKKAIEVLTCLQQDSQELIKSKFENTITSFIQFVTDDESYDFKIFFDKRGNLPVAEFKLKSPTSMDEYLPIVETSGGGIMDILSVGIRIVVMSFLNAEPLIMLDESFKALSENYQQKAIQFVQRLSNDLNYQVLLITHRELEKEVSNHIITIG